MRWSGVAGQAFGLDGSQFPACLYIKWDLDGVGIALCYAGSSQVIGPGGSISLADH
jgi:hypothetical protein